MENLDFTSRPVFIIAELSANHGGELNLAIETIKAAKRTGADAVKLQTYTPDTITIDHDGSDFHINQETVWDGKTLYNLYQEAYTPWEWHEELFRVANEEGLVCFSSPFDKSAVDFLETLDAPAYKIASFEITDIPLIEYVASKKKPVIISTGIATKEDIDLALDACHKMGNYDIVLLKCTSSYPAPMDQADLNMIPDIARKYDVTVGLSDHTLGIIAPVVSVALGAKVIEKHFILDKSIGGPDASFSLDEKEFSEMVQAVRQAEASLGKIDYSLTSKKEKSRAFSRSLYIVKDMNEGEVFSESNIRSIRPGHGLHPKYLGEIIGKKANRSISRGTRMSLDFVDLTT